MLVDNGAKIVVKNNGNGGFNANEGIATFNGGYLEGDGHSGSLFGAQDKANTKIVFGADSVVNTPMKTDSDNGLGQSGTNYIVIGVHTKLNTLLIIKAVLLFQLMEKKMAMKNLLGFN